MNLILFSASGMVGAGALRETLNTTEVESFLSIGADARHIKHPKLRELLLPDLLMSPPWKTSSAGGTGGNVRECPVLHLLPQLQLVVFGY